MQGILEIDLGDRGGVHRFKNYEAARNWVSAELERWQWMSAAASHDRFGMHHFAHQRLAWLRDSLTNHEAAGHPIEAAGHLFRSVFLDGEIILHSEGDLGRAVLDVVESQGPRAALTAYAFALRRISLQNVENLEELRGLLLLANPSSLEAESRARRLTQERRNLRDRADRLFERLEEEAEARREEHRADRVRGRVIATRWVRRRFANWRGTYERAVALAGQTHAEFASSREKTAEEFALLKNAYEEFMRLQAPATYWSGKADRHKLAENKARAHLLIFFPIALVVLVFMFGATGYWILKHPPATNAGAVYVVISGGLATLAGVCFWIGRLLTKLYLSEHHLRIDAQEREIMTTTYLALTKDKAASDVDRQIILSALFRSAPDGIVKDDGPGDLNLPMLLSRLGVPNR